MTGRIQDENIFIDFSDFRNQWLTPDKEQVLREKALAQTTELTIENERSFMATFSATYSLLLLAEYHEWVNQ